MRAKLSMPDIIFGQRDEFRKESCFVAQKFIPLCKDSIIARIGFIAVSCRDEVGGHVQLQVAPNR